MIPVFKPHIGSETLKAACDALDLGWLGMGSLVKQFEDQLTTYLEVETPRRVVAVNTCTSALHLALLVAGVKPGDEVITPALNNIGDFQAINLCGATPVFADICEDDLGLDPDCIEPLLGPRVKAIIALHYTGTTCRIGAIREVAKTHGVRLIEDAAHATGTRWQGRPIGAEGDLACFSFDAIKTLTCIDGGLVVTRSEEEAEQLYPLRLLGMTQPNERLYNNARAYRFDVEGPGFRYHLANLHAAIGLSQLAKLPEFIENRRKYCRLYKTLLEDVPGIVTPQSDFTDASMFIFVIRVLHGKRSELAAHLKERGIDTGVHWMPGHHFSWLKNARGVDGLSVTSRVGEEILTLPLWSHMPDETIVEVCNGIRDFYRRPKTSAQATRLRGRALMAHLKAGNLQPYRVGLEGHPDLSLRVVNTTDPDTHDVRCLTAWRNRFVTSFLTEFEASESRTRNWLTQQVAGDDSRILFMVDDAAGEPLGYIGLAYIDWDRLSGESDSVVRGRDGQRGLMTAALQTLLTWARDELGLARFGVRVLADNDANRFYQQLGFHEVRRAPLKCERSAGMVAWREVEIGTPHDDRWLIHYELRPWMK